MISVILPSVRPHLLRRAYASIEAAAAVVPYQVVIVADWGPEDWPHTTWIVRERNGPIDAINIGLREATGEWLFLFNDESVLEPGSLAALYAYSLMNPDHVLTPYHKPPYRFEYYGKPFAPFPFVHVDVVQRLGGLLDPAYRGFYADPDFSMRAHAAEVPVMTVHAATIVHDNRHDEHHQARVAACLETDRATFRSRWDHLGDFVEC